MFNESRLNALYDAAVASGVNVDDATGVIGTDQRWLNLYRLVNTTGSKGVHHKCCICNEEIPVDILIEDHFSKHSVLELLVKCNDR